MKPRATLSRPLALALSRYLCRSGFHVLCRSVSRSVSQSLPLALILLGALVSLPAVAVSAAAQPPEDPLAPFLRGMADSTDAFFGPTAVAFDTTGIDSLIRTRGTEKPAVRARKGVSFKPRPIFGYHRATGTSLGAGTRVEVGDRARIEARGAYGFGNKQGRFRASLGIALSARENGREGGSRRGRLWLVGTYGRETLPFAPEHARTWESTVGALTTGRDRQSVFERRAAGASLRWETASSLGDVGWRAARDYSMPLATRFSLWGADREVAPVTPVGGDACREGVLCRPVTRARGDACREGALYREGFFEFAHAGPGSVHVGAEARYAARHRWRARVAGAHRVVGFAGFEANLQAEAGLTARRGPAQDQFELGGPVAVPSLRFGEATGNRLVLGKVELLHGVDLLRALRVPHPSYLVLHPGLFVHGGAAWSGRDASWNGPPTGTRRGAAGIELLHLPGIPNPATLVRLQMAWPLERRSGAPRFSVVLGRWHDLTPRR